MKILMLSAFSNHFRNWASQLRDSGFEIYWFDVLDNRSPIKQLDFVEQIINWKLKWDFPGRQFIKINAHGIYRLIEPLNSRDSGVIFEKLLNNIKPDVVHSFEMHSACIPFIKVMKNYPKIKWVYSSMGSDVYYFFKEQKEISNIREVLNRLDYVFTDCQRDYELILKNGFKGKHLGVYPAGGGYKLKELSPYILEEKENLIIVKGYQSKFGRCISVLKAINLLAEKLKNYEIFVFAANKEVKDYIQKTGLKDRLKIEVTGAIGRNDLMKKMGKAKLYIGNSISDGIPNTMLEAIVMGVFPIQSNPGGATGEIIEHNKNGLLIKNPENIEEIRFLIEHALTNRKLVSDAVRYNSLKKRPKLDRGLIVKEVLSKYKKLEIV